MGSKNPALRSRRNSNPQKSKSKWISPNRLEDEKPLVTLVYLMERARSQRSSPRLINPTLLSVRFAPAPRSLDASWNVHHLCQVQLTRLLSASQGLSTRIPNGDPSGLIIPKNKKDWQLNLDSLLQLILEFSIPSKIKKRAGDDILPHQNGCMGLMYHVL